MEVKTFNEFRAKTGIEPGSREELACAMAWNTALELAIDRINEERFRDRVKISGLKVLILHGEKGGKDDR